jgi:hypothetical protein
MWDGLAPPRESNPYPTSKPIMRSLEITANKPGTAPYPPIGFSDCEVRALVKLLRPLPGMTDDDALREVGNKLLIMLSDAGVDTSGVS